MSKMDFEKGDIVYFDAAITDTSWRWHNELRALGITVHGEFAYSWDYSYEVYIHLPKITEEQLRALDKGDTPGNFLRRFKPKSINGISCSYFHSIYEGCRTWEYSMETVPIHKLSAVKPLPEDIDYDALIPKELYEDLYK